MSNPPRMPAARDFAGSIPEAYDQFLGPFCFQPFAVELASRLPRTEGLKVLELACGTGILTEALDRHLPSSRHLEATDLSEGMLAVAKKRPTLENVRFGIADAQELPFKDQSFDAVVCQFGWMFFPDKPKGASEAFRVLKPGGVLIVDVWDGLPANPPFEIAGVVAEESFPGEQFFAGPFGYNDLEAGLQVFRDAGFVSVNGEKVAKVGETERAESVARGMFLGTPMYLAIMERDPAALEAILQTLTERLAESFGDEPLRAPLQAIFFQAIKPETQS